MPWNNKNIKPVEKKSLPYETFKEIYSLMGFEEWQYTKLYNKATEEELNNLSMFVATQREYGYDPLQFWGHPVSRNDKYDEDLGRMIYSNNKSTIPTWMQNCGDLDAVNKFMEENDSKLNLADTAFMMKKADAIRKANEKKKIDVRGARPKVTGGKNHAKIELNQERRQSSFNGCWSCSMQLMLKSRGVTNIEQEDIRAYRPPLAKQKEIEKAYGIDDNEHYNIDQGNEMFSMADAIVAYAPNTMVHETELETYNNDASSIGISRQEYNRNLAKAVKDNIIHAIHVDKSPVGVWHNGHYITVTEIKGDYLFYKDSNSNTPNKDEVISVSKLIKDMEDNEIKKPVKLVWVSDVILSKDGKTLYNVPSTYVQMNEDGTIKLPPEKIQQNGESYMHGRNQSGVTVARIGGIEDSLDERGHRSKVDTDGVLRTEKVYLPKQLNVTLLRKQAERRTDKEELDIAKNSKAFYRTEMPDFLKSKDDIDLGSTTLRLDAPAVKKSKAREDDIHDSKKLTGKGLEDFVNKDIERNEKRLDAEEKRIRKETEARNAAPKMAAFVRDLKTTPMFVMDYLDDEKANAIKNARIRIPKGKEIESINAMVLLYALGHKQWSIDNIVNLSDEQKVKLGDDFIEDMKKHSFIGSVQEIKDSVRYFGDITKKATEQLREENIELLPAKDQKRDVASFIGSNFANISKGWRSKKVYKLKNTEDLVIGNDYAKAFGSKEEYSDAMDYIDSFGGNKRKKNVNNDNENRINDNENRINDNEDNKRREEEEKKRQEDERKLREENERKQREENQKKANDAKYNELRTLLFDPNLDAEGYKKFKEEFDKMPEDYKNKLKEESRQRKEAEKQRLDEEKRQKRLKENQEKLDKEMKSIFGMSRKEIKKREQEIKRQKADQERREKLLAEQKEQERLKKLEEEKEKQRKELEKVDVRTRFKAHISSLYDFIEKKFDTERAELKNSEIKDDDHFSEKYMELSKKELEAKRLSTNFRPVLKKIIPQDVFIETINRSFTDADKELIINECKGRKQILRGKTPNKTNKNEKSDYKVDAEEYIDSANVQIITRKSVLDSFIDALPDEYVAKIDEEMQKLPVLTNLSNEESVDHTHTARLNELKVFTLDHAKGDQKEKERLDKMLDRADNCLTKVKENVHSKYLEEYPDIYWNHYTRLTDRNTKRNKAGYENGQFANYQYNVFRGEPLNEGQLALGDKIEQLNTPALTPKFEQGLLAMLKKMNEMYDLSPEEIDAFSFEEQWKAYGNRQLIKSKTELEKAVDEGNIDKIEEKLLIHEKDLENMREMHRMAKEVFADSEPYSAPGNIDSLRNTHVPLEFVRDNVTDSRVNGVFHLWLASKKCGVSPEKFIKNPAKYVKDASKKKLDDMRVEKKLAEDPVYMLNYAGKYGTQFAGMAMFGLPACVDRGISILASGEPDPVSRSNLYNYIKLGHDHYKIGFDKEYQKCMRLENVFHEEPMEHRDIFVSITGGCILGAGEEYDWNYGAPRIDDFGRTVTEKPKSFMECYKANPVGLYEINSKIGNYIFSFQNSLRPDSPQRFKECNDCFIYGLFENTQTLLRELGPEEPGYHELEITMKYMSNYVINPELKQEMKDKVKQFDTVLEEKHRQLRRTAEEFRTDVNKVNTRLDNTNDLLRVYGPVCDQHENNYNKLEMDVLDLPVPEGYDDDMVAFVTLGATMDDSLLTGLIQEPADNRVFLIENAVTGDRRMFDLYDAMYEARKRTYTALTNLNSNDEKIRNEAKAFINKSCKNAIDSIMSKTSNNSLTSFTYLHEAKQQVYKMADKAISAGIVEVSDIEKCKIHSYAEQIRASERVVRTNKELLEMPAGAKPSEINNKIADLVFDMYLRNTNTKVKNDIYNAVEEISAQTHANVGINPLDPNHPEWHAEYSLFLGEMRDTLGSVTTDPVSAIMMQENGIDTLKELYMDKIKETPEYKKLVEAYNSNTVEFAAQLGKISDQMGGGYETKNFYDIKGVELDRGLVDNVISPEEVQAKREEVRIRLQDFALRKIIKKLHTDDGITETNTINTAYDRRNEKLDQYKKTYGAETDIGNNCTSKAQYDAVKLTKPEDFSDEMLLAVSIGYNLDNDKLHKIMTASSGAAGKNLESIIFINTTFIVDNIPENDTRFNRFNDYLPKNRQEIKEGLDLYSKTGDLSFCKNAVDKFLQYAANSAEIANHGNIRGFGDQLLSPDGNIIMIASKVLGKPPVNTTAGLTDIQINNIHAMANEMKEYQDIAKMAKDIKDNPAPAGSREREEQVTDFLFKQYLRTTIENRNQKNNDKICDSIDNIIMEYGVKKKSSFEAGFVLSHYGQLSEANNGIYQYGILPLRRIEGKYKTDGLSLAMSDPDYYEKLKAQSIDKIRQTPYFKALMYCEGDNIVDTISAISHDKEINLEKIGVKAPEDAERRAEELNRKYKDEYEKNFVKEFAKLKKDLNKNICDYIELEDNYRLDIETLKGNGLKENSRILKDMHNLLKTEDNSDPEYNKLRTAFTDFVKAGLALEKYKGEKEIEEYLAAGESFSKAAKGYIKEDKDVTEKKKKILKATAVCHLLCANIEHAHQNDLANPERTVDIDGIDKTVVMRDMMGGRYGMNGYNLTVQNLVNNTNNLIEKINPAQSEKMMNCYGEYMGTRDRLSEDDFRYVEPERLSSQQATQYKPYTSGGNRKLQEDMLDIIVDNKKMLDNYINNLSGSGLKFKPMLTAYGQIMQYEKGSYNEAVLDNEYIQGMQSLLVSGPIIRTKTLSDGTTAIDFERMERELSTYTDAVSKVVKDGPMEELMNLYGDYNELFEREYEKQKLMKEGMDPESEKKYLENLKNTLEKTLKDVDLLVTFEKQNPEAYEGKAPYQQILNEELDSIVEVKPEHKRGITHSVGQMKGQLQAIKMGWGANELGVLGYIGELQAALEKEINDDTVFYDKYLDENNQRKIEEYYQRLDSAQKMKEKLDKLAEECLYTKVETSVHKKEIFDKVKNFREEVKQMEGKGAEIVNAVTDLTKNSFAKIENSLADKCEREFEAADRPDPENWIFEKATSYINAYRQNLPALKSNAQEMTGNITYIIESLSKNEELRQKFETLNQSKPENERVDINMLKSIKNICELYTKGAVSVENIRKHNEYLEQHEAELNDDAVKKSSFDDSYSLAAKDAINMKMLDNMNKFMSDIVYGENPMLKYIATGKGRDELNNFATAFCRKHTLDQSQLDENLLNEEQRNEITGFAYKTAKEGILMMAKDPKLSYEKKVKLAADFITANFHEHELANGKKLNTDDPVKQLRMEEGIRELAVILTKGNHEQPDFSQVLENNKDIMLELTGQMEYHVNYELSKDARSEYRFTNATNKLPNLDTGVSALQSRSYVITGTEEYAEIRKDLKQLNSDIKKADKTFAETGVYNGEDLARREKELLDRMDAYLNRKQAELNPSTNSLNRQHAMAQAKVNLTQRYEIDQKCKNISATELSEADVYKAYMENAKMEFENRPDRTPEQVIKDYAKYEEKYRKLHSSVIEKLSKQRNAENRDEIDAKIGKEKEMIYNSAFRSVFLEGVNDRIKKGAFDGLNEYEFVNKVKAGYSRNLETVPRMIDSEQGKKICAKIDNDIKKGRLDHNTMVGRVDAELGKKLTRGNAEKALNPPKKPVIGLA